MYPRPEHMRIGFISWSREGKINRIIKVHPRHTSHLNAADQIAIALRTPLRFEEFDVEWCRRDRCYYYHDVGFWSGRIYLNQLVEGYRCKFWSDIDIEFSKNSGTGRELSENQIKKLGYDRVPDLKWQDDITVGNSMYDHPPGCEGQCYFCEVCEDMLPEHDPCDHTYTCPREDCLEVGPQPTHSPDNTPCEHYKKAEAAK